MKTINLIIVAMLPEAAGAQKMVLMNSLAWYIFGALMALLLLLYLLYSLIKPEKF